MGYTVTVDIKSANFPGLGNPLYPYDYTEAKDLLPKEVKNKVKDQYESYYRNASKVRSSINTNSFQVSDRDEVKFDLDYEEGAPKTYKFLGMDIDDNYEAVIPMGDGYVKVAPMFDSAKICGVKLRSFDSVIIGVADDVISKSTQDLARVISTSMKNGALYDLYRAETVKYDPFAGNNVPELKGVSELKQIRIENLDPLVQLVKSKVDDEGSSNGGSRFKSILLNLVDREKQKDKETRYGDTGNTADMSSTVAAAVLSKIFQYWYSVVSKYNSYHSMLSELDLWSNLGKTCMGEANFNAKMMSSGITMTDKDTGITYPGRIISFAGVARDNGISDANTIRVSAAEQLSAMQEVVSGSSSYTNIVMQDIMLGNIDYEEFSNPFDLSAEELQAVSSYDSLKYIDEDAKSCMESYNMNDPEDRSLFIKSAIKSYDRNFRAFKSHNDYDVAQAFSDMVEKGVTFSDRIVSKDEVGDTLDLTSYEVTSSTYAINRAAIKKSLTKVGKLLNKPLNEINDLFGAAPNMTSTNP